MKKFIYFNLLIIFILSSCNVAQKHLEKGEYDLAVKKSVKKLQKNKRNEKQVLVLEKAYPLAIKRDIEKIDYLNVEGRQDRWETIFNIYSNMKNRQTLVETVTPVSTQGRTIQFQHVNYDRRIVEAKEKAAMFFFNQGKEKMVKDNRIEYRNAYDYFVRATTYNPEIYKMDSLMEVCRNLGTSYAIIIGANETPYKLNNDFMVNLIDQQIVDLNSFWVQYYNKDSRNGNYDVNVYIVLRIADVSRGDIKENARTESAKIKDGWEYKLDESGNFATDTLGNKIKVAKYKSIFCDVIENVQYKTAHIEGMIEYEDAYTKQIIRSFPIAADSRFEHIFSFANGNLDALSEQTRRSLGGKPVGYPNDMDMLWDANDILKGVIGRSLWENKRVIEGW